MDQRLVLVNPIDHQRSSPPHIINTLVGQFLHSGGFHNNVKTVRVVLLQLLPLGAWVLPIQLDVFIRRVKLLGDIHFDAFIGGDDDTEGSVQLEQLSEDETCWAGAKEEDINPNWRVELIKAVDGACGWFEQSGLFICEILDLVQLLLVTRQWRERLGRRDRQTRPTI